MGGAGPAAQPAGGSGGFPGLPPGARALISRGAPPGSELVPALLPAVEAWPPTPARAARLLAASQGPQHLGTSSGPGNAHLERGRRGSGCGAELRGARPRPLGRAHAGPEAEREGGAPRPVTAPPPGSPRASPRPPAASAAGSWRRRSRPPCGESEWASHRAGPSRPLPDSWPVTQAWPAGRAYYALWFPETYCYDGQDVPHHL